jgi:hypothetical protein
MANAEVKTRGVDVVLAGDHGFVAEKPEHCHVCYRLIRPGQTYCLIMGQAILCGGCLGATDAIRVIDDLAVAVEDGRVLTKHAHPFESASLRRDNPLGVAGLTSEFLDG